MNAGKPPASAPPEQIWLEPAGNGQYRMGVREAYLETIPDDLVALELAPESTRLRARDTFGILTTDKRTLDLRAPRDLRIVKVNSAAEQDPRLVRLSAHERGWLAIVELLNE